MFSERACESKLFRAVLASRRLGDAQSQLQPRDERDEADQESRDGMVHPPRRRILGHRRRHVAQRPRERRVHGLDERRGRELGGIQDPQVGMRGLQVRRDGSGRVFLARA